MRTDWLDLALDLEQIRARRPMSASSRALELELAILRVEGAQREVRAAAGKTAEQQAQFHLKMAAGHLSKLTKLHPTLPTWKPPKAKKKKKVGGFVLPTHEPQAVYQRSRSEYRGRSERRFVDEFRPGQEHRGAAGVVSRSAISLAVQGPSLPWPASR